jgi:glucokinase
MTIGIDIGGTHLKAACVDAHGELFDVRTVPSHAADGVDAMIDGIERLYRELDGTRSLPLGIGCPGVVDHHGTVHNPPNMVGWGVVPLRDILAQRLQCTIAVDNDANVAAIAEADAGAGAEVNSFLYITLGTGIGGAIVVGRHILRGPTGGAGEVGHIIIDRQDRSTVTGHQWRAGTVEEYAGRQGIQDRYILATGIEASIEEIAAEVTSHNATAIAVLDAVAEDIALALCSACALLGMGTIIIGGGIADAFPSIIDRISTHMRQRAIPTIAAELDVRPATFRNHAGIIGAALLVRRSA